VTGPAARAAVARPRRRDRAGRGAGLRGLNDIAIGDRKRWQTSEWVPRTPRRFVSVSVTGTSCALACDHCKTNVLKG